MSEYARFAEKTPEFIQEGMPLPLGHKTQGQRGDYRVDTLVPATVYLLLQHLCTRIDDIQARVRDIGPQIAGKTGIDLEGKQSSVDWNPVEQRLRHDPGARAHFHNHPCPLQGKWSQHRPSEVTRARSNRANGTKVGHGLLGKCCQIRLDMAIPLTLTEILNRRKL